MPVRPGSVPVVGLPPGAAFPSFLPNTHGLNDRVAQPAQLAPAPENLNTAASKLSEQPVAAPREAAAATSPAYSAPQLPGFGFKYLPQSMAATDSGLAPFDNTSPQAAPNAFQAGQRAPPGMDDPELAPVGPGSSLGAPFTCASMMQLPFSPSSQDKSKSTTKASQLGPPVSKSLFPGASGPMTTDLPSDLSEPTVAMPESAGSLAFSSMLSSLRRNDYLYDEVC